MNVRLWKVASTVLAVLLVSCGTVATETRQTEQIVRVSPTFTVEEPAPTDTLPAPATSTAPPPTAAPSATLVAVRSAADVQRITPDEAKPLLDDGLAVLYDARSVEAYRSQHATGAISFPEADVVARFYELPADKALIFY